MKFRTQWPPGGAPLPSNPAQSCSAPLEDQLFSGHDKSIVCHFTCHIMQQQEQALGKEARAQQRPGGAVVADEAKC